MKIYGRNAVLTHLQEHRPVDKIYVIKGGDARLKKIWAIAKQEGHVIEEVPRKRLDDMADGANHQGVLLNVPEYEYWSLEKLLDNIGEKEPFVIILDGIEDSRNLGAIMRSAEGAGAHGVIIPKRKGVGLTEGAVKTAAGAASYMPCVRVANIAATIDKLKERGLWICGCHMEGKAYYEQNLTGPIGLVLGNEGKGISRLVKEKCDFFATIPMTGNMESLNVSAAAAILCYEVLRQRNLTVK